jgi:hypothetical protein
MNKKKFIIVTVLIFVFIWLLVSFEVKYIQLGMMDYSYSGSPLIYSSSGYECCSGFYILNLIIDIIIWFAVSAGITFIGNKLKNNINISNTNILKYNKLALISFTISIASIIFFFIDYIYTCNTVCMYMIGSILPVFQYIFGVLILIGFILGIISLFRIKKLGNKGSWLVIIANIIYFSYILTIIFTNLY